MLRLAIILGALLVVAVCWGRDVSGINPTFPRIGNCYGAGLGWRTWEQGAEYWSKLDLFVGGCYDLHYDWDNPRWEKTLATLETNIALLRQANPTAMVLPYVDVIEGYDSPDIPQGWWDLNDKGERWSGWPGMFRINMKLPEVLQYNLDMARDRVFARAMFDGIFYDCWSPDDWLCPRTAQLRDGKAVVMLNAWNIPTRGFESLNGVLAEDEINRVVEGRVDFEDFLARYLNWCRLSRKPVTTMVVCRPQALNDDPWRWSKMKHEDKVAEIEKARQDDEQTMRFGLATTLMGDGYFGYDAGTAARGNWWWYKEYDAPLGYPKGDCTRNEDGTWQRDFDGGTVVVNGSGYDAVVRLQRRCRDLSTGRVGDTFTLPMFDGRIFLPTDEPETATPDIAPRLTATPPETVRATSLPGGTTVIQAPRGLELRFSQSGQLQSILLKGRRIMGGGFPVVATHPFLQFQPTDVVVGPEDQAAGGPVERSWSGQLARDEQRVSFIEKVRVHADNRFTLKFDCEALTDLDIRMWRHYFTFPVPLYAGAKASAAGKTISLPESLGETDLLSSSKQFTVDAEAAKISVESTLPLALVDHRRYGTEEYLLAGYPVWNAVKRGTKISVEMTVTVTVGE